MNRSLGNPFGVKDVKHLASHRDAEKIARHFSAGIMREKLEESRRDG